MQLVAADLDRIALPCPARQQDLGEAAGRGSHIQTDPTRRIDPEFIQRRDKLARRPRHPGMGRLGLHLRPVRDFLGRLGQHLAIHHHLAGRNRLLGLGPGFEMSGIDEIAIGAHGLSVKSD